MSLLKEVDCWRGCTAPLNLEQAQAYCADLARSHYENFPVVTAFLPRRLRPHFYSIYAFCRWADDLGDETGDPVRALELLAWWTDELQSCYAGRAHHPVYVALRRTIDQFQIPIDPFRALISAFEQDQLVNDYQTMEQLEDYCRRSANPVGELVLRMAECLTPETRQWSDSICTGLQLANFWQDVARDAAIGRTYLPKSVCQRHGYSDEQLQQRRMTPEFVSLMQELVEHARSLLLSGRPLIQAVPRWLEVEIDLFIQGGLQILTEIERIQFRVWETRPVISKWTMASLFVGSLGRWAKRRIVG